ncbi:alpha-1/alpha-2 family phenol-soluble modulin [Staphylococcus pseudintermedius]|nr:alpha-1/alpha-2 family phenol-soluble modulin [Staphylococcus pseudintermedius]
MMWADIILGIVKLIKGLIDTFKKIIRHDKG